MVLDLTLLILYRKVRLKIHLKSEKSFIQMVHVFDYLNELNRHTFGGKDLMTVGEMSSTTIDHCIKYTKPERQRISDVFNFHHLRWTMKMETNGLMLTTIFTS